MNYIAQRDVLKQIGISISTLKRWQKHRGFPDHISVSETVKIYDLPLFKCIDRKHKVIIVNAEHSAGIILEYSSW